MLLQLSAPMGIQTDTITCWNVSCGSVKVFFSGKSFVLLNTDEAVAFLKFVECNGPECRVEMMNRLRGIGEQVNAE